jgi:hypothetical protein
MRLSRWLGVASVLAALLAGLNLSGCASMEPAAKQRQVASVLTYLYPGNTTLEALPPAGVAELHVPFRLGLAFVPMSEAFIVAALRTAGARKGGRLAGWHPADLAAQVLDALVARLAIDPALIDDVIIGCVGQAGEQSFNIARNAILASCCRSRCPASRSTGNAAPRSRRCTSPRRR